MYLEIYIILLAKYTLYLENIVVHFESILLYFESLMYGFGPGQIQSLDLYKTEFERFHRRHLHY